jgi:transcriptional regulator GlxA family with amidase domain
MTREQQHPGTVRQAEAAAARPVPAPRGQKRLRVGILLSRNFTLSAFSLFVDTLRLASDELDKSGRKYIDWDVLSDSSHLIGSSCGVSVAPTAKLAERQAFDYLAVVGGRLNVEQQLEHAQMSYLKSSAARGVPVIGLCTGSFVLAEAGLLNGKTACVSWLHREDFHKRFPDIALVSHQLFMEDGSVTTCAGGTAVADLAAAIVTRHIGSAAAKNAMEILQVERRRDGKSIQARLPLDTPSLNDERVKLAMLLMDEAVHRKCNIGRIARRVGVSPRQLERLFKLELGETPIRSFQRIKLDKAKMFLEHTDETILRIATELGYESQTHFSRMFRKLHGLNPAEWRAQHAGK